MMKVAKKADVAIVGGGVIGLSLAYELSGRGHSVCVFDQGAPGREASWAGAGMIPPGSPSASATPSDRLAYLSQKLHPEWAAALQAETGIDNGYRQSGSIHLGVAPAADQSLGDWCQELVKRGIRHRRLSTIELSGVEPSLSMNPGAIGHGEAVELLDEAQIRSPRHLRALLVACRNRGVNILAHSKADTFLTSGDRVDAVQTDRQRLAAGQVILTAGCWSGQLAGQLGANISIRPIRGQLLLLRKPQVGLRHILVVGTRYLVPREDDLVLVGSTEEDVGFKKTTTTEAIDELRQFAVGLLPNLSQADEVSRWSGLRPLASNAQPIVGRLPGWSNVWLATGHYRAGLQLSPATATLLADSLEGKPLSSDVVTLSDAGPQPCGARRLPAKSDA